MNKQFTLTLDCDNAAFEENPVVEIGRIMRHLANTLGDTDVLYGRADRGNIRDDNGNTVGTWRFVVDDGDDAPADAQAVRS